MRSDRYHGGQAKYIPKKEVDTIFEFTIYIASL